MYTYPLTSIWHSFGPEKSLFSIKFHLLSLLVFCVIYCAEAQREFTLAHLTTKICIQVDKNRNSLRARHKACLLRPDTGPCRADIIQYYYDALHNKCFRFFWGGCQGNGNRFETAADCVEYCRVTTASISSRVPYFCSLAFDFGNCFGHYNRWAWDKYAKTCKRRIYSGCGGNQNNFETRNECMANCLNPPNNTMHLAQKFTTCIPLTIQDMH